MSESSEHLELVDFLVTWLGKNTDYCLSMAMLVDAPTTTTGNRPPRLDGFVPDVFMHNTSYGMVIIGEAKSAYDIETNHSRMQYAAFLRYAATYSRGIFILAVPWFCTKQMRSLVRHIQKKTGTEQVQVIVIDQLPG